MHLHRPIWSIRSAFLPSWNPLAERTCFSQVQTVRSEQSLSLAESVYGRTSLSPPRQRSLQTMLKRQELKDSMQKQLRWP